MLSRRSACTGSICTIIVNSSPNSLVMYSSISDAISCASPTERVSATAISRLTVLFPSRSSSTKMSCTENPCNPATAATRSLNVSEESATGRRCRTMSEPGISRAIISSACALIARRDSACRFRSTCATTSISVVGPAWRTRTRSTESIPCTRDIVFRTRPETPSGAVSMRTSIVRFPSFHPTWTTNPATPIAAIASACAYPKCTNTSPQSTTIELKISELKCSASASSAWLFVSIATFLSARARKKSTPIEIRTTTNAYHVA